MALSTIALIVSVGGSVALLGYNSLCYLSGHEL